MWVLIDNYDSFTYILLHYLLQTGNECVVYRNDEISLEQLIELNPSRIIISPGPETPLQAGISLDVIRHFHDKIPILGVCLGHQAIGMFFGATLKHAPVPMHGKISTAHHSGHPLFNGIENSFDVMRYHSLVIEDLENTGLKSIAHTGDGCIMAIVHEKYPCVGIQFHPESVGTGAGLQMLKNWSSIADG
ncbi:anthranilate synthase component II [Taibaiella soli]|uniref:Aminodeoxychorismate/anthranilate synthase component II n=1 Tax=Taibaiella soli TaxID=1649169 RepID=A0A2W2AAG3_9BACT|nr:aminodeoxychorismate/anthranilate synthase component II [Taibaiella soli]PZF72385.1 aminodeoxychorismate/anthranilate synthase component II [Taibaiella soli]